MPLKALESPTAVELSESLLLLHDVRDSFTAMKLWFQKYAPENGADTAGEDAIIADALFRDTVVQFVGCFDPTSRYSINKELVFSHLEGGPEYIERLQHIRNSYAAHKFGTLRQCVAGVAIDESGAIIGVGHIGMRGYPFGKEEEEQMLQCMSVVGRYLEAKVKDLEAKLLGEAQALKPEDLLRLPNARAYVPASNELRISREKLRNIRRSSEKGGQ